MTPAPTPAAPAQSPARDRLLCLQVESLGVNGLALARGASAIGFRAIPLLPGHGRFDGKLIVCTLVELGPHDPGDAYHHVSFQAPTTATATTRFLRQELFAGNGVVVPDFAPGTRATVHLEWAFDGERAVARLSADAPVDLLLLLNGCTAPARAHPSPDGRLCVEQEGWRVHLTCRGECGAPVCESSLERLECRLRGLPLSALSSPAALAGLRARLTPDTPLCLVLAEHPAAAPTAAAVAATLETGRAEMAARLMASTGAAEHCADALQRLVGFAAAYDPRSGNRFVPVNRDWAGANSVPPVFLWDNVFDSYLACFHHPALARESLAHLAGILLERGLPDAPPQRNLIVPVVYAKTVRMIGDRAFAAATFPAFMHFMRFWFADRGDGHPWRDGNDDGLIECGSCRRPGDGHSLGSIVQDAFDETGYDDSPMYSAGFAYERRGLPAAGVAFDFGRGTLNLTMVGQNALYVASCRALAVVARWLGEAADERWLTAEAVRVAARIRERLFDPLLGCYQNRFFDGLFSPVKTPDLFSPLLAGLADAPVQARLREMLLDPRLFWGDNVIPTVSRDDPAYRDDTGHGEYWRGNYWRGNVWGPTNYITYLAVRNAGWTDVAAEFATRSRRLFMDDWLPRHHANENYPPEGGTAHTHLFAGNGGRDPHYIWSALLALLPLEELFSCEDVADGIRFGTVEPRAFGAWSGFLYHGARGSVAVDAAGLRLDIEGLFSVRSDRPLAVRQFQLIDGQPRFQSLAGEPAQMTVDLPGRRHSLRLPAGPHEVE